MATQADIEVHYDVDNDFFALFLDKKYRAYSTGLWSNATNLEDAQYAKFKQLCQYANIKPNDYVMDVGSGWGGFMNLIADDYANTQVHGITISSEQFKYVNSIKKPNVSLSLCPWQSYEPPERKFDAIVSVEVFEHFATVEESMAGRQRDVYRDFFEWCLSISSDEAQFALQTIVITRMPQNLIELNDTKFLLNKVFPGSALSSISDIQAAIIDKYEISAVTRMRLDYVRTLIEWHNNLFNSKEYAIKCFGKDVFELYIEYLRASRRCFESGYTDVYQVSLTRAKPIRIFIK